MKLTMIFKTISARQTIAAALVVCTLPVLPSLAAPAAPKADLRNRFDRQSAENLARRAADWRNGTIVYQVIVDRFAPGRNLEKKKALYAPPRKLRTWDEVPRPGTYVPAAEVWSHELDFWGGDLDSLRGKLDYIQGLGVQTVYLNPVFQSLTNHKYDTWDYNKVDPVCGTRADLKALATDLHGRKMRLVLDGVFNHVGRQSPFFKEARANPHSRWRPFFSFIEKPPGYVGWMDVANLPELRLEEPAVQEYLFSGPDAVMPSYVRREGIDGWRLDVAFDIGFEILAKMTQAVHKARADTEVIGEIWNYPEEWFPSVDGVMNMHGRAILLSLLQGKLSGPTAATMWDTMIADAGIEPILKSWLILDNHDTKRLVRVLGEPWQQRMARVLQATLPGSMCLYYGSELGMDGGDDPEQRAPMRWDLTTADNATLEFQKAVLKMRNARPALRHGDFRRLHSERLFAFLRRTNAARQTVVVVANPTDGEVTEQLQLRESKFQDWSDLRDVFTGQRIKVQAGMIEVTVPPRGWEVLEIEAADYPGGYNRYDRLH